MAISLTRHRFTTVDYHKMAEAGILRDDDRVELIEGEIVEMAAIGPRHAACVARLDDLFGERLRRQGIVWPQNSIRLGQYSELRPDLVLLRWRSDFYAAAIPGPEDALLVIEVADTTLLHDCEVKVPLYARSGIGEVWVLDLNGRGVIVHREPTPEGYHTSFVARGADRLSPQAFPELVLTADQILG